MSSTSDDSSPREPDAPSPRLVWDEEERREVVGTWALQPVGRRPRLGRYVADLWNRRHFIWADSRAKAFSGNGGFLLGNAWLVLSPILDGITYYLIFGLLLGTSRGIENFVGYLIIGVFLFSYTARSLTAGANVLASGRTMIRGFSFPRAALPISAVLREFVGMGPVLVVMIAMILFIPPYAPVTWLWLFFPGVIALQTIFNAGIALIMARLTSHLPDLRKLVGFFARLWMYGSAVMFSFDRFVDDPELLAAFESNPAFIVLDMTRDLLLYEILPSADSWLRLAAWAGCAAVIGFLFFWRGEERYGRE